MITRDEKKKLIKDFYYFKPADGLTVTQLIDQYLDSLEMNKEKAIEVLEQMYNQRKNNSDAFDVKYTQALKFAIDYMKSSWEEGEIIGWVNYYPEIKHSHKIGSVTFDSLESAILSTTTEYGECIHIPIRLPIELKPGQ